MEKKFPKWILEDERGKRPGQKFRSLLVMQFILKNADNEHAVTIEQIEDHLASMAARQSGAPFGLQKRTKDPGCPAYKHDRRCLSLVTG